MVNRPRRWIAKRSGKLASEGGIVSSARDLLLRESHDYGPPDFVGYGAASATAQGTARVSAPHQSLPTHAVRFGRLAEMSLLALEPYVYPEGLLEAPAAGADPGALERWWVLHTRPRAEKALSRRCLDRSLGFFLPVQRREWLNRGRRFRSYLPLFPGYVFLHGDDDARLAVLETNLVAQVLPVMDQGRLHADLARIHRLITGTAALTPEDGLTPGDPVKIVLGPFAGLTGKVLRRGKELRFVVEVEFLRRAVSMEIDGWMIRPVGSTAAAG